MSATIDDKLLTTEELLALPASEQVERWLIRGELREKPMTRRSRIHAETESKISYVLHNWRLQQAGPRGKVYSGEVGCRLRRNPDSTVGIDVAYVSAESAARQPSATRLIDGPPVLAVEILSPTDQNEEINEKIEEYLSAGVSLVWIVEPRFRTVTVYRPDGPPQLFSAEQQLSADPHLPGFSIVVKELFE